MRAVVCPEYGSPEVLRIERRPLPRPGPGQARIRVRAAAVNFPDVLLIAGRYQVTVPPPFVPGSEFAGHVTELGPDCPVFAIGDRVSGTGLYGAFAEEIVVPATNLAPIPPGVDDRTAAAFGVAHRTAYHALRSVARVRADDTVVVLGAGGGVGLAAVQLARALGAEVVAIASSPEKLSAAASYGAKYLIDHRESDVRAALRAAVPEGATAVLDPVGGDLSEPALRALGRGGRFVTIGYASGTVPRIPLNLVLVKGLQIVGFQFRDIDPDEFDRNERELAGMLTDGRIAPHIGATFPLADTARALERVAAGRAVGKVVIDVTA
ncbi:NADPH:quinone oxidoreductase family protein [Nocardia zapadnayensis]|uniref:NADPH:quinone oxidoreductase family protein n=1 Tax=Nocardia rhamnosiphila TaxID=426716 RepID=UPI00224541B9|nr:NADPH:quinone oxidoreductase family protein [Nocardia zapadnayensis]MCX0274709.1 NADPH:quinone oxidoreductase family protein [Nocardia zapadnayensis]